ncbi:MAG: GcrA cell cycle regulator [Dasania sp.]|jgi:GcrA cell cycle regulator
MAWTQERINLLVELWMSGKSASTVAKEIGNISRNAVIGKVHRLGIASRINLKKIYRPKPKKAPSGETDQAITDKVMFDISSFLLPDSDPDAELIRIKPARKTSLSRSYSKPMALSSDPNSLSAKKLSLLELNKKSCRWPSGDPGTFEFSFCGADCKANSPYCDHHSKIAYSNAPKKEAKQYIILNARPPVNNQDNGEAETSEEEMNINMVAMQGDADNEMHYI